jgi:hypothetical protein
MAYETTAVSVDKSQAGIRKLIMARKGSKIAFISDPPREGFQAEVQIDSLPYTIRIFGEVKRPNTGRTDKQRDTWLDQEHRRIWRVIFYHLKSVFEAADSGVMEFRELMLPYIVTKSGQTVAECIVPQLAKNIELNPARLLA